MSSAVESVTSRITNRLNGETYDSVIMGELIQTIVDRLSLRLGVTEDTFPSAFISIAVDATVKAWRRRYYEGLQSEDINSNSDTFVEDILNEYQAEIEGWLQSADADSSTSRKVVRFL